MEASHAAALEAERETSRQKLEALFLDYEKARDEALEKESEWVALSQRTEQLQAALAEAKSTRKLQKAKVSEAETGAFFFAPLLEPFLESSVFAFPVFLLICYGNERRPSVLRNSEERRAGRNVSRQREQRCSFLPVLSGVWAFLFSCRFCSLSYGFIRRASSRLTGKLRRRP
jgi:hypothetical protein